MKLALRMRSITSISRESLETTYLESPTPHCLFTVAYTTFMELRWRLRVVCAGDIPHCKTFWPKFFSPLFPKNVTFGHKNGLNINCKYFNPQKAHPCVKPRLLSHRARKSVKGSDPVRLIGLGEFRKQVYTGWLIKTSQTLALNCKSFKLK